MKKTMRIGANDVVTVYNGLNTSTLIYKYTGESNPVSYNMSTGPEMMVHFESNSERYGFKSSISSKSI
jgi:hypothetical protein